jgi:UDP-glucose 6-dehydrogenase
MNAANRGKECGKMWRQPKSKAIGLLGLAFKPNTDDITRHPLILLKL